MTDIQLIIEKPGMLSLLQDSGRKGYQSFGVPESGPLDRKSAILANQLVGNQEDCPVIEMTIIGPSIRFTRDANIAITGANLHPKINDKPISLNQLHTIKKDNLLTFEKAEQGCRSYLAVAGDWNVTRWLGSASAATHESAQLTPQSVLRKGLSISITPKRQGPKAIKNIQIPRFSHISRVRVMAGPEFESFSKRSIGRFFSQGHRISPDSNRMGYRLENRLDDFNPPKELISSGTVPGTIQITNEGQPIVLMADAQTTGGYYRLGNVIDEDLDILGQLKPGDEVWFSLI